MKSGNLNFLEPSGPLQACNGTALPVPYNVQFFIDKLFCLISPRKISKFLKKKRVPRQIFG